MIQALQYSTARTVAAISIGSILSWSLRLTEMTAEEVKPRVTDRFAVMNTSVFSLSSPTVRLRILVTMTIPAQQSAWESLLSDGGHTERNNQSDHNNNHITYSL